MFLSTLKITSPRVLMGLSIALLGGCQVTTSLIQPQTPETGETNSTVAATATTQLPTDTQTHSLDHQGTQADHLSDKQQIANANLPLPEGERNTTISQSSKRTVQQWPLPRPTAEDAHLVWLANEWPQDMIQSADFEYAKLRFLYPQDLWHEVRTGFQFDLDTTNPRVTSQYNWYSKHQTYMNRVTDRANRYMFFVVEEIKKRNMPMEMALLPIVESAYDPFAYSHGRASGMWQFIPSTGKMFGLKQNWWYDGRRDVVESTRAALDFLIDERKRFNGDWLLALAAYNSGPGTVMRAIRKNRKAGKPVDYWSLDLPKETRHYVPKLIALAKIIHDPEGSGIALKTVPNRPYFAAVDVGSQIDLAQAARMADMELSELYLLNPGFNQWATSPDGPHRLLVPVGKAEGFEEALTQVPADQRITWKRYEIRSGDTIGTIAQRFNTTVSVLKDVNSIRGNTIVAGKTLLIPVASQHVNSYSLSADQRLANKQSRNPNKSKYEKVIYQVKPGDSFWEIARRYGVGVRSLAKWNGMAPTDLLRNGQELVIWVNKKSSVASRVGDDRKIIRKVGYKVRNGDSLYRIANKFNVSVTEIRKWNTLPSKYLQPGQMLTLYVDVTRIQ